MKIVKTMTIIFLMILISSTATARTAITIGGSYWRGSIKLEGDGPGDKDYSKASNMIGPYLNLRMNKISIGASYFSGAFDFSEDLSGDFFDITLKLTRKDLNFSLGYSVSRNVSIFGAYKQLTWGYEYDGTDIGDIQYEDDESSSYLGGGLSIQFPFTGSPLFLFGSVAYLTPSEKDWEDIVAINAGIGFHDRSGFAVMVGYRLESLSSDDEGYDDLDISGIMATIAYTIR